MYTSDGDGGDDGDGGGADAGVGGGCGKTVDIDQISPLSYKSPRLVHTLCRCASRCYQQVLPTGTLLAGLLASDFLLCFPDKSKIDR